jgi:hypothetical protein
MIRAMIDVILKPKAPGRILDVKKKLVVENGKLDSHSTRRRSVQL